MEYIKTIMKQRVYHSATAALWLLYQNLIPNIITEVTFRKTSHIMEKLKRRTTKKRLRRSSLIGLPKRLVLTILTACLVILGGYLLFPEFQTARSSIRESSQSAQLISPQQKTASPEAKTASPEAKIQPEKKVKTPAPIPTNSGRSVKVPIIYYHYIGKNPNPADKLRDNLSVDPDLFEQQMAYIASSGFNTINFNTLYTALKGGGALPPKPIIITFDDGYIDFYVNAFPILRKYNLHVTQFIPTSLVDTGYYLHWDQIKEMDATGLVSFEAHSLTHANLVSLSDAELKRQVTDSKHRLETELGKLVNTMAYPYGVSDTRVWQAAKTAGYIGAAGTWGSSTESEGNIYDMPRYKIPGGLSLEGFKKRF
jgi:peptidoglycan/xylan/chitin deacetylase (PgdA/CDA1 family)